MSQKVQHFIAAERIESTKTLVKDNLQSLNRRICRVVQSL